MLAGWAVFDFLRLASCELALLPQTRTSRPPEVASVAIVNQLGEADRRSTGIDSSRPAFSETSSVGRRTGQLREGS